MKMKQYDTTIGANPIKYEWFLNGLDEREYILHPEIDLNLVVNKTKEVRLNTVMINAFGPNGACSSLIIKRFKN